MFRNAFRPGDRVPKAGVYWVHHFQHRLAHPSRVLASEFPYCSTCGDRVRFEHADVDPLGDIDVIQTDIDFNTGDLGEEKAAD